MKVLADQTFLDSYDAFIFDCDGTLVETLDDHYKAWEQIFIKYKINKPLSFLSQFNSIPSYKIGEVLVNEFPLPISAMEIAEEKEALLFDIMNEAKPISEVVDVVIKYYGKVKYVVISGGVRKNVVKSLELANLLNYFPFVVGADDKYPPKTDPRSFLEVAEELGVNASRCLVFEDGEAGMEGARKAGMGVVDVRDWIFHDKSK